MTDEPSYAEFVSSAKGKVERLFMWTGVKKLGWPQDTLNKFKNLVDASAGMWTPLMDGEAKEQVSLPFRYAVRSLPSLPAKANRAIVAGIGGHI